MAGYEPKVLTVNVMKILAVGEYKGAKYLLQRMGNAFQYIVLWEGQFYQSYTIFNPEKGKEFTHAQEVEIAVIINNFMETTVDTLIAGKIEAAVKESKKKDKKTN